MIFTGTSTLDGYYPYVYLVTSAKIFGCGFNPASFWYLYSTERQLRCVVAEVNNTFGERRMYLFPNTEGGGEKFKQACEKDFHVSPFSSRKGTYVLSSSDPAAGENVAITTTLCSSKGHPKLVARWWSTAPAIDPAALSMLSCLLLLSGWGWMVLLTFPRILFQAVMLAYLRKLHIWYRPEPTPLAVARRPTNSEALLATILVRYLRVLVESACFTMDMSVSCAEPVPDQQFHHHGLLHIRFIHEHRAPDLSLGIHTPQFYRQMITYESLAAYLSSTLLDPYMENHTAWSKDAEGFIATLQGLETAKGFEKPRLDCTKGRKLILGICWAIYSHLRWTACAKGAYPNPGFPSTRETPRTPHIRLRDGPCFWTNSWPMQLRYMLTVMGLQWRAWLSATAGGE
ncbi:hypothetical protein PG988_014047 [Apiospora saccharicola]